MLTWLGHNIQGSGFGRVRLHKIQGGVDQFFYRTRYDYRKTLIEFGRELSAETDLDTMLSSVVDRLSRTLLVDRMAIFLSAGDPPQFFLAKSFGMTQTGGLDLTLHSRKVMSLPYALGNIAMLEEFLRAGPTSVDSEAHEHALDRTMMQSP